MKRNVISVKIMSLRSALLHGGRSVTLETIAQTDTGALRAFALIMPKAHGLHNRPHLTTVVSACRMDRLSLIGKDFELLIDIS